MRYEKFYSGKLEPHILEHLDDDVRTKRKLLLQEIDKGEWTEKQKIRQRKSIVSNIALYKTLIDKGVSKEDAKELVKEHSFYVAEKFHKVLSSFFRLPGFFRLFRYFMRKGMAGEEIWKSKVLRDDSQCFSMDVFKCLWADTCSYFDCYEICEVFCLCDHIVFGNIDKMEFKRTQTLGMRGEKCDFCFLSKTKNHV